MTIPAPDPASPYYDAEIETMPRADLEALQWELLSVMIPHAYEHAPLIRKTWDDEGVHPRDVKSLDDYRERVPFIDKDAIRRFRDEHGDPYGGLCTVPPESLTAIMSTSGTTGDPTLVPESWGPDRGRPAVITRDFWGFGVRPGDHIALILFTFRGPTYGLFQGLGTVPVLFDYVPEEMERFCRLSLELRPTGIYNFGAVLFDAVRKVCEHTGIDPRDVFSSYKGVVIAGEPLGVRARALAAEWGVPLFEHTSVGDVTGSFECVAHDGLHYWEDTVFVENLEIHDHRHHEAPLGRSALRDPAHRRPVADGERGELVATALVNKTAPLIRYRSDDIVRVTTEPCACGRTHARMWPIGRRGDEIVVEERSVLPVDVWAAVESVDACALGLFQIVRTTPVVDRLRLRVGYAPGWEHRLPHVRDEVEAAVHAAVGVTPEVELVPDGELLRLGPPHKIPRVAKA